jgi:hypothetical protein
VNEQIKNNLRSPLFKISDVDGQLILNFDEEVAQYPKVVELVQ